MTPPTGRLPGLGLALILLFCSAYARAEVEATVDRHQVTMGDTLRLVIRATDDKEELSSVNLSGLQRDFEVLQRSTKSSTRIINGQRSHERELVMEITPMREGTLRIPAFKVGPSTTRPITVLVNEPPQADPGTATVLFEAELDRDQIYVQEQLILTLRLQQAINLDRRTISELELPNAFVVPLEQQSFQRTINGRPWLVHEVRYAIFPEQSGTLEIPAQSFSARESKPRGSFFDSGSGQLIRRNTANLTINVLPRPADYPVAATWLPARALTLEEKWSSDPADIKEGESVTRTIEIRGAGLQGAQLPPAAQIAVDGLKYFPDQPSITDSEVSTGVLGTRTDSTAIVPTRSGQLTLPEVRIPWWDTQAGALQIAVLPARTLNIAPAQAMEISPPGTRTAKAGTSQIDTPQSGSTMLWQFIALGCALGWLVTLALLLQSRRKAKLPVAADEEEPVSLKGSYKQLLAACASDNASLARAALLKWSNAISALQEGQPITRLGQTKALLQDQALDLEIEQLQRALYSGEATPWSGSALATTVQGLHKEARKKKKRGEDKLALYPTGAC